MIRSALAVFLAIHAPIRSGDDPAALVSQATAAYDGKDYAKAARLYAAAVNAGAMGPNPRYNAACCMAQTGKTDEAIDWLKKAIDAGWRDAEHLKSDADLRSLHPDPRWGKVIKRCEEEAAQFRRSLKEPGLRDELLKRMKEDQRIRMQEKPDIAEWHKIDGDNTAFMKTIIEKHGWPGRTMVGSDGAQAAFLMVQHADADHEFQKRCLDLLAQAVEQKEATPSHLAYLTDRVLVAEGKPQRFGTQFIQRDGELKPQPIEDEANVDARRREVGLEPLAEYTRQMRAMQKP